MNIADKKILDVCSGGKMFWFNKNHADVLYLDNRTVKPIMVGKGRNARKFEVKPDAIADFKNLPIKNNKFKLVVFDPPHFTTLGKNSYMGIKYGILNKKTWKQDLKQGFSECFRVLKNDGILVFKWNEHDILLSEVLKLSPYRPLFGHPSGKTQKTHWVCFMKSKNNLIK